MFTDEVISEYLHCLKVIFENYKKKLPKRIPDSTASEDFSRSDIIWGSNFGFEYSEICCVHRVKFKIFLKN